MMTADAINTSACWWTDDRTWVVGVDGSHDARAAMAWAVRYAPHRATALDIVSAWQPPVYSPSLYGGPVSMPFDMDTFEAAARAEVDSAVTEVAAQLEIPVHGATVRGGASNALLDAASKASLLVVGSRGRGGFGRLLLGSTSSQCATHAEVPTVVVPDDFDADGSGEILVGLDGSPNSLTALDWALRFGGRDHTVHAVWIWDTTPLAVGADEFFFPDAGQTAEQRFHHLIDETVAHVDGVRPRVERSFRRGRPRHDLAELAQTAELAVVGARGHGAVGAALLGSVSSWLLHHVERPLVVVPHGDDLDRGPVVASASRADTAAAD